MARTPSNMLSLGTPLPPFDLPDTEGNQIKDVSYLARLTNLKSLDLKGKQIADEQQPSTGV